ncbi:MAG: phage tail sheath C-terminal domain-containing protein, partial [Dehalococcoidia bacterium]
GHTFTLEISPFRGQPVLVGDLLQMDFTDGIHRAYAVAVSDSLPAKRPITQVTVNPLRTYWFRKVEASAPSTLTGSVRREGESPVEAMLEVDTMMLSAPIEAEVGDWLRLETGLERVWMLVGQVLPDDRMQITSAWFEGADTTAELAVAQVLRVQIALQVREGSDHYRTLSSLACAAPHPRFIGFLPDDAQLFASRLGQSRSPVKDAAAELWEEVNHPRFPLGLTLEDGSVVIPLGLGSATIWRGGLATATDPLARDGLVPEVDDYEALSGDDWAGFGPQIFIDPQLRFTGQRALMNEANDRLYVQEQALTGMHALLPVEEVSMIALPDVAHRGWVLTQRETLVVPSQPEVSPPDPCATDSPFAPKPAEPPAQDEPPATAESPAEAERTLWKVVPSLDYSDGGLLAIQTAAAQLAAARGDLMAVLGMPKGYRAPEALQHQRKLSEALRRAGETTASYVVLYHPWLVTRDDSGDLLHTHPAGGVCGVMAARSLRLGAWVAPANETVQSTLAAIPALSLEDHLAFISVGINPIIQNPTGFAIWGAYTQSEDPELEDINVRRLLILLRRVALVEGQKYAFGPNGPDFRRRIQQQLEQRLSRLFARGAFAGREPAEAYRIVIDETVNTAQAVERGRLIVELRVAPSQPVTFITVRLVQSESGLPAAQEITNGS